MSLGFAKEVMAMKLDPEDKSFSRVLATKQSVMQSVLTASVRMNDPSLRKKSTDRIGALLDELKDFDD